MRGTLGPCTTKPLEVFLQQMSQELLGPGTQFGRYRIVRLIGAGAMGTVYEATHVDLKKQVAFKALNPAVALDDEARKRFLHEGEVASKIRHPNVVEVFDVGIEHNVPYLVMEFLEGEALSDLLAREAPLSPEKLASIMLPVLAAVATAHEEGVLHRDIKPDNIFLARSRHDQITPKLLDFGISKLTDAQEAKNLTGGGTLLGTPMYMSPEAATRAKHIDARSDQYSLGVILYEASTGHDPFDGDTLYTLFQAIVAGRFAPPRVYQPELPQAFEALVCRAMATEPEFRFPSVAALGRALLPFAPPRDCVIWGPAFEPKRVAGSPLTPSEFPSANMELQSLKSSFLDSDLWTVKSQDPSLSEPDEAGVFKKPSSLTTLDEDDPAYAPSAPQAPRLNGHTKTTPGAYVWDASERAELPKLTHNAPEPRRASRPSQDRPSLSTLDDAVVERVVENRGRIPWALGGGLLVLLGVGVGFMLSRAQKAEPPSDTAVAAARPSTPRTMQLEVSATPSQAELLLDGVSLGVGPITRALPSDGREHMLTVRAEGFEAKELRFVDTPPRGVIALKELMPQGLSAEAAPTPTETVPATDIAPAIEGEPPAEEVAATPVANPRTNTKTARRGLGRPNKNRVESQAPAYAPPAAPSAAPVIAPRAAATANDAPILD